MIEIAVLPIEKCAIADSGTSALPFDSTAVEGVTVWLPGPATAAALAAAAAAEAALADVATLAALEVPLPVEPLLDVAGAPAGT